MKKRSKKPRPKNWMQERTNVILRREELRARIRRDTVEERSSTDRHQRKDRG